MRPHRKRKEHHRHLGTTGSAPGASQPPRCMMSASVKHPQPPQHPQPPRSATNRNSVLPDLLDQAELGRLYKPACLSISKDTTTRSCQDNFSRSNLSFNCSQRSNRDYFSGLPCRALNKNWHVTDPLREASSVSVIAVRVQAQLRPLHSLHYLMSQWTWGQKRQKPLQPPAFHGRTALQ